MATNYPTSLDALTNPTSSDSMSSPSHSGQHADANDAIEALQSKVGVDSSAVATSLDYRVTQLESGGGSMTTSATAPSSPSDGDMWYDTSTGRTYVYYNDGSSSQWVEFGAAPDAGIMHVSSGAPSSPNAGDMWYDTDDGTTSLYYDDGSSQQWVQFGAAPVTTGKILQVVNATHSTQVIVSSTTYGATGLTASITPSSTSSKVLVIITNPMRAWNKNISTTTSGQAFSKLYRNGSEVHDFYSFRYYDNASIQRDMEWNGTLTFMDSPGTTSSVSYEQYIASSGTNFSAYSCYLNNTASITLMEVAG